ncbi:MAG: hypothetical protein K6C94_05175 [Candidatus Gastranaerophilales bacterium]|nr:hypothetical protein [Candidatus Gastranaerophilales bacterium]
MEAFTIENLIRTYKYIAIFSTVAFILKFIIFSMTVGDGSEVSSDFDSVSDTDTSFHFFSIQSVLAFLMGFGWVGLAALSQWHTEISHAVIISVIVGFVFMFSSAYLMLKVRCLNQVVTPEYDKCVGKIGKAYTTIHPNTDGQIEIEINGRLSVISAMNNSDIEIKAFEPVKVVKFENEKLYIEKE